MIGPAGYIVLLALATTMVWSYRRPLLLSREDWYTYHTARRSWLLSELQEARVQCARHVPRTPKDPTYEAVRLAFAGRSLPWSRQRIRDMSDVQRGALVHWVETTVDLTLLPEGL